MEELIFLKRRNAFLEEKIKVYENLKSPIINTLPLMVDNIDFINDTNNKDNKDNKYLSIVLIKNKKDRRCPVIKVPIHNLIYSIKYELNNEYLEITDYINKNKYAEKYYKNGKWIWKII